MAFKCIPQTLGSMASSVQARVERDIHGRYVVRKAGDRSLVGRFHSEDAAKEALAELGQRQLDDLDAALPATMNAETMRAAPPRFQDTLTPTRRVAALLQAGPLSVITPFKAFTQAVEKLGKHGSPFTNYYQPTQKAIQAVGREMAVIKRAIFGGKSGRTFQEAIHDLEGKIVTLPPEQRELVTLWKEAYTKQELELPGVFLRDGMTPESIATANTIAQLDMADRIPEFLRLNKVIDDFLVNRQKMVDVDIPRLEVLIQEGKAPENLQDYLNVLRQSAGDEVGRDDLLRTLGLTQDESLALNLLKSAEDLEHFNIPAIFRHATAPKLEKGFKNGREQFVVQRGMSPQALQVAKERDVILAEAFRLGKDRPNVDQVLGAQLPVFRAFVDAGIFPARGARNASKLSTMLSEALPEGDAILTRRVLSGHLNPHELHPGVTTFKHVRNMVMRENFDPILPEVKREIQQIAAREGDTPRISRILLDNLHELEGLPNESFRRLTASMRTVGQVLGVKIDDRLAERVTALLGKLAYQASIPFRPALVMRNYMQTAFFTAPVVGPKAWVKGLEYATNPKTMRAAFDEAVRHGAIDPDVVPLFGSTEIFGIEATRFSEKFGTSLAKAGFKVDELFQMGFSVYRSADDWGRAVAFHAGRTRVREGVERFVKSPRSAADLRRFKKASRIGHFDETIEAQFDALARAEDWTGLENLVGKELADKTHLLYGNANHPVGWGGVGGRLFGQFGTFPVQYLNYVLETSTRLAKRESLGEFAEFVGVHGGLNVGVIVAGAEVMGADLTSWATFPSLTYTGGPYADVAVNLFQMMGGSDAERSLARRNLSMMFPTFENPRSIFVPGSYFVGDFVEAFAQDDLLKAFGEGAGLRFLKPGEKNSIAQGLDWIDEIF